MCAAGTAWPGPWTQSYRGFPTAVLEAFWKVCQAAWPMAAHGGRIARRPRACDQGPAGRRVAGVREAALAPPCTPGVCRRRQAQVTHARAGGITTGPIAPCGDAGDGHGARHATPGLEGLDHRGQTPRVHRRVACLCKTREACGVCGDGPHVCLEDHLRRWRRTDDRGQPSAVGGAPMGLARLAPSLPPAHGVEAACGGLEIAPGRFARAAQVPDGCVRDLGAINRGQLPSAPQAGPVDGVAAVGFDPIPGLLRDPGGGHDPADRPVFRQLARAPRPAGAGVRDQDAGLALRVPLPQAPVEVTLAGADATERHPLGPVCCRARGDSHRLLRHLHADITRARLLQG